MHQSKWPTLTYYCLEFRNLVGTLSISKEKEKAHEALKTLFGSFTAFNGINICI